MSSAISFRVINEGDTPHMNFGVINKTDSFSALEGVVIEIMLLTNATMREINKVLCVRA